MGDIRAVAALVSALKDEATHIREAAAVALGRIGDPAAIEPLTVVLNDTYASVRHAAAEALTAIDPQTATTKTAALRDNGGPPVRGLTPRT